MDFKERKPNMYQCSSGEDDEVVNSEFLRLRQNLPAEVWLLVAKKLQKRSSDGIENLANSSAFFQNLLASQRTNFLFEKVFPILAASIWKKEGLEGLPVSDVLKLRGVSKHWNFVIDKLIPEKFQYYGVGSEHNTAAEIGKAFKKIVKPKMFDNVVREFDEEEDDDEDHVAAPPNRHSVHNFLSHFDKTHPIYQSKERNPWIWRKIAVEIDSDEVGNQVIENHKIFMQGICSMITKYGGHLQSFSLETCIRHNQFFENPTMLQKWLSKMPNLKEFSFFDQWEDEDSSYVDLKLEQVIRNCPFPKLKFLEKLEVFDLPMPMFNQLIRENNHVSTLSISHRFVPDIYDVYTFPIPNLRTFELLCCPDDIVERLGRPEVQWKLESLNLFFDRPFNFSAILQVIQTKFANTLVELTIETGRISVDKDDKLWLDCKICQLDLPKLKKICVKFGRTPVGLDFLLPMKRNLEEITASFEYKLPLNLPVEVEGKRWREIVQFVGFEEAMLESNIWAIFKKLKTFRAICTTEYRRMSQHYSRDDWMLNNLYD